MKCKSEWQRPATAVRIRTSRGPGLGRLTSSITSGLLTSCRTAAFIGCSLKFYVVIRSGLVAGLSLRCRKQFANLRHADGTLAQQMRSDRALRRIFREPERMFAQLVHLQPLFIPPCIAVFPENFAVIPHMPH